MAYSDYDTRYHHRSHHDSYHQPAPRDTDAYSTKAMRNSSPTSSYPSSYRTSRPRYAASPPPAVRRSSAQPPYRHDSRKSRWPPSPSVEDEAVALSREYSSSLEDVGEESSGEAKSRGSVDQYPLIQEIAQPRNTQLDDERRFVLVSDPHAEDGPNQGPRDRRRKSFAERGNMPHLKTDMDEPSVFTERTSTPYAYTKPQKESLAPSAGEYFLSPDAITPSSSSVPRSVAGRDAWDARDQNARPSNSKHTRYDSYHQTQSTRSNKNDVFDDSDVESEASHLRAPERRAARYSFTKSDLQKDDLRTNVLDSQAKEKSERRKRDSVPPSTNRDPFGQGSTSSSGSSKHTTPQSQSPRSSSSSVIGESRKSRPPPMESAYAKSSSRYPDSRPTSRPSSPSHGRGPSPPRSPKLPPRRPASPTTSRPSSRSGPRPASPLSSSQTGPRSSPRVPVTESDWNATYPPTTERHRPTRYDRYDSMPVPAPRIDVQSPSPARPPKPDNPLPYPVDERQADVFMPPEEQYQYDHSHTPIAASPRQSYPESHIPSSPRERPAASRPNTSSRHTANPDELPRSPRVRSNSIRSQSSHDGRKERERERKAAIPLSLDKPLPSCPRSEATSRYNDWYTLENCPNFDLCPSCYEGVFSETPFSVYFSQTRRYERSVERVCDFSSPWMRLAWLIIIKQRRPSLDLLYTLAAITDQERACPGDRELSTDHVLWYGIPDQRDGVHVANFAICPCDLKMMEALFPSVRGYFTPLPASNPYAMPSSFACSLRITSRRFPKYLDLLVELDAEAQLLNQHPNISRFVQAARENAFKNECSREKPLFRKLWHFIPHLPEFTVCQECFDELVWPAMTSSSSSSSSTSSLYAPPTIPKMFNRTIQPVPNEDPELGSSCCLYSTRMRKVWARSVEANDFGYLQRKAMERKRAETRLGRERKDVLGWMAGLERGSGQWAKAKLELKGNEAEWKEWE